MKVFSKVRALDPLVTGADVMNNSIELMTLWRQRRKASP
jgi:hypothetical protein